MAPIFRAATAHISPSFLSAASTLPIILSAIRKAAQNNASLICFPESFLPGFPLWLPLRPPTHIHSLFNRFVSNAIHIDGPEISAIRSVASECRVAVSLGFCERGGEIPSHASESSTSGPIHTGQSATDANGQGDARAATLWNSNIIIDGANGGAIVVHHRKLMPTWFEKLVWSPGDGYGLRCADLVIRDSNNTTVTSQRSSVPAQQTAKVAALVCGENSNPLARYSLMAQGEQIHISSWPAIWPTRVPQQAQPTQDQVNADPSTSGTVKKAESKNYDNVAANKIRAAAHCFEAKCFGIVCAGHLDQAAIETAVEGAHDEESVRAAMQRSPRAASMFLDPSGAVVEAFTIDDETGEKSVHEFLQNEPGILYADLDLELCIEGKQYHDVVGGYQRFDVFDLKVDRRRRGPATFVD